MARLARVEVFAADGMAIVHVMNRTVLRVTKKEIASAFGLRFIIQKMMDSTFTSECQAVGTALVTQMS